MRYVPIAVICLLLLSCSKPAGLENGRNLINDVLQHPANTTLNATNTTVATPANITAGNHTGPVNISEQGTERAPEGEDAIYITTTKGKGHIEGTVDGVTKEADADYDDVDALIFDAADLFDLKLYEARFIAYVNGNRYMRPSDAKEVGEELARREDPEIDTSGIPYILHKEDGFIRALGCDRKQGIIVAEVHNFEEEGVPMWRDVKPRIKESIVFRLNKVVLSTFYCEDEEILEPGTTYKCRKSGVSFVEDKQTSTIRDDVDYGSIKNEFVVQKPGYTEIIPFTCPESAPTSGTNTTSNPTNTTDINSSTTNTTNSTA